MMNRRICILAALFAALPFAAVAGARPGAEPARPNVIFFLVDDLGAIDTGVGGSSFYLTPYIDRLAAEGMRFEQAYASHPRCVPSRFSIMTGQFPARAAVPGGKEKLDAVHRTFARALNDGGYRTYFLGKWHLGGEADGNAPEDHGFDVNIAGGEAGAPGSYVFPYQRDGQHAKANIKGLEEGEEGEMLTDRLTAEAERLIRGHVAEHADQPFFLELSHYGVHTPLEDSKDRVREFRKRLRGMDPPDGPEFVDTDRDGTTKQRQDDPTYAAMISRVDDSLGTLLALLDELELADNTVIVFTSDHGGLSNRGLENGRKLATSNLPLRAGKGHLYEGGIRVPLIVRWPGEVEANSVSTFVTVGADHYPAFLELGAVEQVGDQIIDGVSYLPALRGEAADRSAPIYWHSPRPRPTSTGDHGGSAIRVGHWKLLHWYDTEDLELYDLSTDPYERNNLAESMPDKAAELDQQLAAWLAEVDAPKSRKK